MPIEPGQQLSHYRIVEKLGEGGMGVVWRAEDTRLGRQVALKVLRGEAAADPARLARFETEARAVAGLNHPNIVTLHAVEEAEGVHFVTFELVDGRPLRERIADGTLSLDQVLELAIPLADGVSAAHARGIVHRDLKPDNVMLSKEGRVKVLDFGLAKLLEGDDALIAGDVSASPTETKAGVLLGTLAYMSPEQAQGQPADERSDVFSIGILLHEMTTGRHPFEGTSAIAVISAILKDPSPSLSDTSGVPPALERIVHRCLEKDAAARYPSARELCDDLQALARDVQGGVGEPGVGSRPAARSRRGLAMAGVALVVLAALAAWFLVGRDDPAPIPPPAQAPPSVAILPLTVPLGGGDETVFADGIHDDMIMQASKIGALKVISRTSVMGFRDTGAKIADIAAELGVATVVEGSVRRAGDRVRVNVKLIDAATEETLWGDTFDRELTARNVFEIQSEIVREIATALEATLTSSELLAVADTPTENLDAYLEYLRGMSLLRGSPSDENLWETVRAFENVVGIDPSMTRAWARLSTAHAHLFWRGVDRSEERQAAARAALERAEALEPAHPETAMARGFYAYWCFRDYSAAPSAFAEAERGLPNDAALIAVQAFIERRLGQWDASFEKLERALDLDPLNTYLLLNQSMSFLALRKVDDSLAVLERTRSLEPDNPTWDGYLASSQLARGDGGPARAECSKRTSFFLDLFDGFLITRDFDAAMTYLARFGDQAFPTQLVWTSADLLRGEILALSGRLAESRPYFERTRETLLTGLRDEPDDPRLHAALGLTLAYLGERAAAIAAGERAVALLPYAKDAMNAGSCLKSLVAIQARLDLPVDASATLDTYLSNPGFYCSGYFARHPRYDTLHGTPVFEALLERHPNC